jgi:hypothetical protein
VPAGTEFGSAATDCRAFSSAISFSKSATDVKEPHLVARDLGRTGCADGVLDLLGEHLQLVLVDRPALTGAPNAGDHLGAVERLAHPTALDDSEDRLLDGGESSIARRARATTTGGRPLVGLARIDDPAVGVVAERAAHLGSPPSPDFRTRPGGPGRSVGRSVRAFLWTLLGTSGGCPGENLRMSLWTGLQLCNY